MWNLHKIPVCDVNDFFFIKYVSSKLKINHLNCYKNAKCILYISLDINLQAYENSLVLNNWIYIKLDQSSVNKLYKGNN